MRSLSVVLVAVFGILTFGPPAATAQATPAAPTEPEIVAAPAQETPSPEKPPKPPTPPTPPVAPRAAEEPRRPGQLVNVRLDITITDQKGSEPGVPRTLTLTLADRENGMVRSAGPGEVRGVPLDVDAFLEIEGNKIRLRLSLSYGFVSRPADEKHQPLDIVRESISIVLDSGKPMVVAQSADPIADRRITLEVKATILR